MGSIGNLGYIEKSLIAGILFTLTIANGVVLSAREKPYGRVLHTMHKLAALLAVVVSAVFAVPLLGTATGVTIAMSITAACLFIVLFVTGVLMSVDKAPFERMRSLHLTATVLLLVISAAAVLLWLRK